MWHILSRNQPVRRWENFLNPRIRLLVLSRAGKTGPRKRPPQGPREPASGGDFLPRGVRFTRSFHLKVHFVASVAVACDFLCRHWGFGAVYFDIAQFGPAMAPISREDVPRLPSRICILLANQVLSETSFPCRSTFETERGTCRGTSVQRELGFERLRQASPPIAVKLARGQGRSAYLGSRIA